MRPPGGWRSGDPRRSSTAPGNGATGSLIIFHLLAGSALLVHCALVFLALLLMALFDIPVNTEGQSLALHVAVVVAWVVLLALGLVAWVKGSWFVLAVPVAFGLVVLGVVEFGGQALGWSFEIGY